MKDYLYLQVIKECNELIYSDILNYKMEISEIKELFTQASHKCSVLRGYL
jgi:hypothetical protein